MINIGIYLQKMFHNITLHFHHELTVITNISVYEKKFFGPCCVGCVLLYTDRLLGTRLKKTYFLAVLGRTPYLPHPVVTLDVGNYLFLRD